MFPSTKGRNPQGSQWMSLNSRWSLRHADAGAASRKQGKQKHKTFKNLVETSAISESKVGRIDYLTHPVVNYKIYAAWTGTENANYVKILRWLSAETIEAVYKFWLQEKAQ